MKNLNDWYDGINNHPEPDQIQVGVQQQPNQEEKPEEVEEKPSEEIEKIEKQAEARKAELLSNAITSKLLKLASPEPGEDADATKKEIDGLLNKLKEVVKNL